MSGLERVYIPSRVADNHYLGDSYVAQLRASGSTELVKAWLEGDWSIIEGAYFDCWSNERHVVKPFAIPNDWARFRSGDWGSASPFSIGWWAIAGDDHKLEGKTIPRGALIRYREWYGSNGKPNVGLKFTAEQVADGIAEREKDDPKLTYAVLDPAAFKEDGGPSIAERINMRLNVTKRTMFRPADNARVAQRGAMGGWDQMRSRLVGDGERPMIFCFSTCLDSIRTIPALQHDVARPEDLDTESEDHAADDWRYACMSRPWIKKPTEAEKPTNVSGYRSVERSADSWKTY